MTEVAYKDSISFNELFIKIREWWVFLLSRWLFILIMSIVGGIIGFLYANFKKPTYTGVLTFVLSNDSKSGGGGLANLAGQLGFDVGGSGGGAFEGENIVELLRSRKIIKGALFGKVPGTKKTLINILGEHEGFFKAWSVNGHTKSLIPFPDDINAVKPVQDSLITAIYSFVVENSLKVEKKDKKLVFYNVSATSTNETIAIFLAKNVVEQAAKVYIETKTKVARENLIMLQSEADSLRAKLGSTIYRSAIKVDNTFNLNPALQAERVSIQQNQIQGQVLGTAYAEVVKNLEIAKINLLKETPLYQVIDEPQYPLLKVKLSRLKTTFILGIFFFFITVVYLFCQRVLKLIFNHNSI